MPDSLRVDQLPPGPRGRWIPTLQIIRNPRKAFTSWRKKYGDPCLIKPLNGPIVFTGREDLIRRIFGEDPSILAPFATETVRPILGEGSLLMMDGDRHKRERRLIMPMFHGDRMRAYGQAMHDVVLEQFAPRRDLAAFDTLPLMTDISLEIIVRTIFGAGSRHRVDQLLLASRNVVRTSNPLLFFSKAMQFRLGGWSLWDRFQAAQAELFRAMDEELDHRQSGGYQGDDILSLLATSRYEDGSAIDRGRIREELLTFLFAGHETSALAMTWAIYHLHRYPETLKKLQAELEAIDDTQPSQYAQAPYLKAVVQETLRIHPIVTEVIRLLKQPIEFDGYQLPAGMSVAAVSTLAHYNEEVYPEPDLFRPERFLERSFSPFEYLPFGGGHRRCIGAAFATFEMAIALGTLLKRFNFQLLETKPVTQSRRSVTLGPSSPIRIRCLGERGRK